MIEAPVSPGHDAVRETDREWVTVCQPLATIFDAVLTTDRAALTVLLEALRTSACRREARTVIRLTRLAKDPLSDLGTLARNALRTWIHLRRLGEAKGWTLPAEVVEHPRPTALLNLATAAVDGDYAPAGIRASTYQPLLERLMAASQREHQERRKDIERVMALRTHTLPNLWPWLDRWLER